MTFKRSIFVILMAAFAAFTACQDDIPLLGEDENGVITPKDSVFIKYIALHSFSPTDPFGSPWDLVPTAIDSLDPLGPDIFYSSYNDNNTPLDSSDDFMFRQNTHFLNVTSEDLVLGYFFTAPIYVPHFNYLVTLNMYDAELDTGGLDSTFMDVIQFVIDSVSGQPDPYVPYVSGIGMNGSQVSIGLEWK